MSAFPLKKWYGLQLVLLDPGTSVRDHSVYARLLDHHNVTTNLCFPIEKTLGDALNCSPRSIRTALKKLESLGYIRILRNQGPRGANMYLFRFPTGKFAYKEAEKQRLMMRKNSSTKPKKDPKKKPMKSNGKIPLEASRKQGGGTSQPLTDKQLAQRRQQLEDMLVERLGGGADAWEKVQNLPRSEIDQAVEDLRLSKTSIARAVEAFLARLLGRD